MCIRFNPCLCSLWLGLALLIPPAGAGTPDDGTINDALGLLAHARVVLPALPDAPAPFSITLPFDGLPTRIDLEPHALRAPHFQVREEFHPGMYRAIQAPQARTLRGTIDQHPEARVAGSLLDIGLVLHVDLGDGRHFGLEPLKRFGDAANAYALYDHGDVQPHARDCLVLNPAGGAAAARHAAGSPDPCPATGLHVAELAIDADHDYFSDYGSVDAVVAQIEAVINAANLQYERDVAITHVLTAIVVRSTPSDPYTSSSAEALLNQVTDHWAAQQVQIERDLVQLFTGRDLIGSTIGVAWLGVHSVCGFEAVSLVESNYNGVDGNFACKVDLSAHEMGHNWNAGHCTCSLYTMHPTIGTCTNAFHPTMTIPAITNYRNTRPCIDAVDTPPQLLRVRIEAPATTVAETASVLLRAWADLPAPPCTADADVTAEVVWSVDPPSAGVVDASGRFSAAAVDGATLATVSASYSGAYGNDTADLALLIEDIPGNDATITVALEPAQPLATLVVGATVAVDVLLSTAGATIPDVRLVQFDLERSSGVSVVGWQWQFDALPAMPYGTFVDGTVRAAAFSAPTAAPGLLATLDAVPQRIATALVRLDAPGQFDVLGNPAPATTDDGVAVIAGFDDPQQYRLELGNVVGAALVFAITDDSPLQIIASSPPGGAIDARQPSAPDGSNPSGWREVRLTFNGAVGAGANDFSIETTSGAIPFVSAVDALSAQELRVTLDAPPVPGTWLTLIHLPSGSRVRLGSLPADVNGDGISSSLDLLSLIDALNGIGPQRGDWSTDINRSGATEPLDILRAVDLLNGAGVYAVWNGVALP